MIRLVALATLATLAPGCQQTYGIAGDQSALTGLNDNLQLTPFHPAWRRTLTPGRVYSTKPHELAQPAYDAAANLLAVGSMSGWFNLIRASDGRTVWRVKIAGGFVSRPVFDGGRILVGTDDGELLALAVSDGRRLWSYRVQGAIAQAAVVAGDKVYFVGGSNSIYAIDRATGAWRWQHRRDPPSDFALVGESGPLVIGGRVYVGFSDGHLSALDADDGAVLWTADLAPEHARFQDADATPVLYKGTLYAASTAAGLYALDPESGKVRWTVPILGVTGILEVGGELVLSSDRGMVLRVSAQTGQIRWRTRFPEVGGAPSHPSLVAGGLIAVGLTKGAVYFLDAASGRPVQRFSPGQGVSAAVTGGPGRSAYFLSNGGVLYAFR